MLMRLLTCIVVVLTLTDAAVGGPYEDGLDAVQRNDFATALRIFRSLAETGDAQGENGLGVMHANGWGMPHNYVDAVKWYRLAAEQGFAKAQYNLGLMYGNGEGVQQDIVLAHMWFSIAVARGLVDAIKNRAIATSLMTPEQIAEAQRLAREWKPRPEQ